MPSSSTRKTHAERKLRNLFVTTWYLVYHSNSSARPQKLIDEFAELLDDTSDNISSLLFPSHDGPARRAFDALNLKLAEMEKSEMLDSASSLLCTVARFLTSKGRKAESEKWAGFAEELKEMSEEAEVEEDEEL